MGRKGTRESIDTQADGKPSYEARESQNSQLNSELAALRRTHDSAIKEIGDLSRKNATEVDGRFEAQDCAVSYKRAGRTLAVATISRDLQNLQAEAAMKASLATGPIV